ncbi:MAG: holo-ACP synthase [Clostridia bacterium]|nr:holo-ACP synthase [Clostridia bacterium]MDD4386537.1 holo-ACP synthase [Clostridia bacterium]
MYCGTDIIEVSRIKEAIEKSDKFKYKIFTEKEIQDIDKMSNDTKYQRYAGKFAAKESVYKAISKLLIDNGMTIEFKDIEIENVYDLKRRPKVNILVNEVKKIIDIYNIDISISHVKENAIAMCVVSIK